MTDAVNFQEETLRAHTVMLGLMFRMVQSVAGTVLPPGEGWRNDAQRMALKLFQHGVSLKSLAHASIVRFDSGEEVTFIDISSMAVVARAALETFLVWHYIFAPGDVDLSRFRHATWKLAGQLEKLGLRVRNEKEAAAKRAVEADVDRLRDEVRRSPHFRGLKEGQKTALLKGDWKVLMGPRGMAQAAGFHEGYFHFIYTYFCAQAHSGHLSARLLGQEASLADQQNVADSLLFHGVVTLAHFVCNYSLQFPKADAVFDEYPVSRAIAKNWMLKAEDLAAVFGATS